MITVRRKTQAHKALLDNAVGCTLYSEGNQYEGEPCKVDAARTALDKFKSAKLVASDDYSEVAVKVHDLCWFILSYGEEPPSQIRRAV